MWQCQRWAHTHRTFIHPISSLCSLCWVSWKGNSFTLSILRKYKLCITTDYYHWKKCPSYLKSYLLILGRIAATGVKSIRL